MCLFTMYGVVHGLVGLHHLQHHQSFLTRHRPKFLASMSPPTIIPLSSILSQNILLSLSYFLEGPVVVHPSTLHHPSFAFVILFLSERLYYFLPRNDFTTTILPLRDHLHATFEFVKTMGLLSPPTNHKSTLYLC